ncbi:hypothetical protein QET40_09930 [Akkermansia sp. N21169]|nr:hypothetical protein [Akkermansia sp. N21169]
MMTDAMNYRLVMMWCFVGAIILGIVQFAMAVSCFMLKPFMAGKASLIENGFYEIGFSCRGGNPSGNTVHFLLGRYYKYRQAMIRSMMMLFLK